MIPNITPVLLGGDLNAYQLARELHARYGLISYVFGRYPLPETAHSRILRFSACPDLWDKAVLLRVLRAFAATHPRCLLFGCTDRYVQMICDLRDELSAHYLIPYADADFLRLASDKAAFGNALVAAGFAYPQTEVVTGMPPARPRRFPLVLKAANSADFYAHPFPEMKKAYLLHTPAALFSVSARIRAAGYTGALLLQDYIPGDDTAMYVANGYTDRAGNVRQVAVGQVLLGEHTPNGIGNPAAIVTRPHPELVATVLRLAAAIGARGLWNFDIRYDKRDGNYYFLECNPRQGRSAFSITSAGLSVIEPVLEDLVFDAPFTETRTPRTAGYWSSVASPAVRCGLPKPLASEVSTLTARKQTADTLAYEADLRGNLRRRANLLLYRVKHLAKFYIYDRNRSAEL